MGVAQILERMAMDWRLEKTRGEDKRACLWARDKAYYKEIREAAPDILASRNFASTAGFIQHGNMSVRCHVIHVAKMALYLADKWGIDCDRRAMVRGALLHDFFLYDWHIGEHRLPWKLHGFYHPGRALRNAKAEFCLGSVEEDVIIKHMWPLTVVPPRNREAWLVSLADKCCSLMETFHVIRGCGRRDIL